MTYLMYMGVTMVSYDYDEIITGATGYMKIKSLMTVPKFFMKLFERYIS